MVKRATYRYSTRQFCSNVAKQVARFLLLVFPYLKLITKLRPGNKVVTRNEISLKGY